MFNNISRRYDFLNQLLSLGIDKIWRKKAIQTLHTLQPRQILDVATGTGEFALEALKLNPQKIIGIDISEGMLEIAKKRTAEHQMDHVTLHRMDAGAMEFADSTFDTVVAAYVVTAVPDYRKVVSEMIRVCRPGGRIIMLNHFSNENKMVAAVEKVLSPLTKHLGWRTDLSLDNVLEGTELQVARKQNVNPLRFWALVECVNCKDSDGMAHKKSAAYANGTTVYTPTPSSLSAGATNEEALA